MWTRLSTAVMMMVMFDMVDAEYQPQHEKQRL